MNKRQQREFAREQQEANRFMAFLTGIDEECEECEHRLKAHDPKTGQCMIPACGCIRSLASGAEEK